MNKKRAFSLVEVLLVLGIIAVVTTMGLSLSKKGMEKAYNQYWYTGYQALYDGSMDAFMQGKLNPVNPSLEDYSKHIGQTLLKCTDYNWDNANKKASFTAKNGIKFEMKNNNNNNPAYFIIDLTIPTPLTKNGSNSNKSRFVYYFQNGKNIVYPANFNYAGFINLHDRVDILPFYVTKEDNSPVTEFYGFRNAYCRVLGNITMGSSSSKIDCSGIPNLGRMSFAPIDPRKIY